LISNRVRYENNTKVTDGGGRLNLLEYNKIQISYNDKNKTGTTR